MRNGNLFVLALRMGLIGATMFIMEEVGRSIGRSEGQRDGYKDGYLYARLEDIAKRNEEVIAKYSDNGSEELAA